MRLQAQMAEAELDAGNVDAAYEAASRAVAIGRKTLPAGSVRLASSLFALGRATLAKDRPLEAEQLFAEALAARSPPAPRSDLHVIEVQIARIQALSALGKTAESRALRAEILPLLKASPYPRAKELLERVEPD